MCCVTICGISRPIWPGSARIWSTVGRRPLPICAAKSACWRARSPRSRTRRGAETMALARSRGRRSSIDIWPGFVDALAQLLMVIIFILLVFTAGQFYLSVAVAGCNQTLQRLQQQVNELGDLLAMERRATADLRVNAADLSAQLASSQAERDRLTGQLRDADATVSAGKDKIELQLREIESLRRDLDALKSVRADLEAKIAALAQQQAPKELGALRDRTKELETRLAAEQERTALAQKEIDARDVRLREVGSRADRADQGLAAEKEVSRNALARVDQLNAQLVALRDQLSRIASALEVSEAKVKEQQGQIIERGKRLNLALVNKVEELARYRS